MLILRVKIEIYLTGIGILSVSGASVDIFRVRLMRSFGKEDIHTVVAFDKGVSSSFVHNESAALSISSEAYFALERSLLCVDQLVFVKTRIFGKPTIAILDRAGVRFFSGVDSHVIFEICRTRERFVALGTFVRSLAGVSSNVDLPDVRSREGTTASVKRTQEWPFPRVSSHVFQQISRCLETLVARVGHAFVRLFARVSAVVSFQTVTRRKRLFTFWMRASVRTLTRVRSLVYLQNDHTLKRSIFHDFFSFFPRRGNFSLQTLVATK